MRSGSAAGRRERFRIGSRAALTAVGLLGAGWLAWGEAQRRSHGSSAAREANVELVRLGLGIARCSALGSLPESSPEVPARLAEVSGKTYASRATDWTDHAFRCAGFQIVAPQYLQYRWVRDGERKGRVEARADSNGDGKPEAWWEVPVSCEAGDHCEAPNYQLEVTDDGERLPPLVLRLVGRASAYRGVKPWVSAAQDARSPAGVAPKPPPPPVIAKGTSVPLDVLFVEAERRAVGKVPGATLLELSFEQVEQRLADPSKGTRLRASYGAPDAKGKVKKGEQVVSVSFDGEGLSEKLAPAKRELRPVGLIDCLPEKLLSAAQQPVPFDMTLAWDDQRSRALWQLKTGKEPARTFGADKCALVR